MERSGRGDGRFMCWEGPSLTPAKRAVSLSAPIGHVGIKCAEFLNQPDVALVNFDQVRVTNLNA